MKHRSRNLTRLALLLIAAGVIGNVVLYLLGNSPFNVYELSIEQPVRMDQTTSVLIQTETGTIDVVPIQGDEIKATLGGKTTKALMKDYKLDITQDGGQTSIKVVQDNQFRFFDIYTDLKLTVGIPEIQLEQLKVVTDTGNIDIGPILAKEYRAISDTGSIKLDIEEGIIHAETDTGEITASLERIRQDIHATSDTGDITIQTVEAPKALRTQFSADSGTVQVTLPGYKDGYIGEGGPLVKLISDTGNLKIEQ
ncbi:DUF4097 family beta strand repeat-containing protein [Paenibacillus sp. FSL R7-0333]|uniref:DUF4097 family beta strand repeat-containing protein n=1 Tax=unclassified Paenibacillus TaxID=185978 RepID=UPI00096FC15C|nr:hypothetical protein BK146_05330 [Paenibacillus sp. FSL R7-0333]